MHDLGVGDDERTALFHGARAELRRLAGDDRLVLLVDDLDLLDDTSVAVLVPLIVSRTVFLDRHGADGGYAVAAVDRLAARRSSGPSGSRCRCRVTSSGRCCIGPSIGPVSSPALAELARLSGGNLQVLTELVRGARERGVLVDTGGAWHLTAPLPTTTALEELVAEHLADVDAAGLAVLELLAVCERFGLADLERIHGAATLEALEASRLVTVVTSGRRTALRLAHPLYGEVLRERLPPLRLRRIHQQLADLVEAHGARRREDVVQVALWRVASGGQVPGDRLLRAARLALVGHDPALAVRLVTAAADDDAVTPGERAEVLVEAHAMQGHDDEVERVVAAVWDEPLTDAQRANLSRRLADTRFYARRDLDGALAAHEAARAAPHRSRGDRRRRRSAGDAAGRCRPTSRSAAHRRLRRPVDHRPDARRAGRRQGHEPAQRSDAATRRPRSRARRPSTTPICPVGWPGAASPCTSSTRPTRWPTAGAIGRPGTCSNRPSSGPWPRTRSAPGCGSRWCSARSPATPGRAGRRSAASAAVVDAAPSAGQDAALVWAHVGVAQGHLLLGECGPAAAALQRADEVGDSPVATSFGTRERTRAWLDACRGDLVAARARIRQVVSVTRRDEVFIFEAGVLNDLVRLGVPDEAVARLQELAGQIDGPLVQAHAGHALAASTRDVDLLSDVVDRYEAIDALGLAAEVAAELADLYRARAETRRATAAQQRSADLADRAGGIHTPVLARGSSVEPLTAREREVALLAAGGISSREVGQRLHLSTRTVDTHLARVYRKLGITSRTELAPALGMIGET